MNERLIKIANSLVEGTTVVHLHNSVQSTSGGSQFNRYDDEDPLWKPLPIPTLGIKQTSESHNTPILRAPPYVPPETNAHYPPYSTETPRPVQIRKEEPRSNISPLRECQSDLEAAIHQNNRLSQECDHLKRQKADAIKDLELCHLRINDLSQECDHLKRQNENVLIDNQNYRQRTTELSRECNNLKRQIEVSPQPMSPKSNESNENKQAARITNTTQDMEGYTGRKAPKTSMSSAISN